MQIREKEISQDVGNPREQCKRCRTLTVLHTCEATSAAGLGSARLKAKHVHTRTGLSWTQGLPAGVQLNSSDSAAHAHWNGGTKSVAGGG